MAKQDIRGDTPNVTNEQKSDILLVMDKKELSIRAVSDMDDIPVYPGLPKHASIGEIPEAEEHMEAVFEIVA